MKNEQSIIRIEYKGYTIENGLYNGAYYTVQYHGDDLVFKSVTEAKRFIDVAAAADETEAYN